jgi:hypothetical protein
MILMEETKHTIKTPHLKKATPFHSQVSILSLI